MLNHKLAGPREQQGSMMLEGLIAAAIFALGILGLIGLQATSMKATTQAKERIDASLVANERIAALWLDRTNLAAYNGVTETITSLPGGQRTTAVTGDLVTVTVTWQIPGYSGNQTFAMAARINGN